MQNDTTTSRRGLLAGVPAIAVAAAPVAVTAAQLADDPIVVAIESHTTALRTWLAAHDDEESTKALHCEIEAMEALFTIPITTPAGVAAWLAHLASEYSGSESIIYAACQYGLSDFHEALVQQFQAAAAVLREAQS